MKKFEKLRIIEAGETRNTIEDNGKRYKLVISAKCFPSLVALGNERPIHARRTHNGEDLLDGYIGNFTNFSHDENAVYADLAMSEALETAYPSEFAFMVAMIEKEPELLGVSVNQMDVKVFDDEAETATVTEVTELFSADLVGLPAATSSLFSNNNNFKNSKNMSKFSFKGLISSFSKTKLATETFTTVDGTEIVVSAAGDEVQVGDSVTLADGSPAPDGDYQITTPDGDIILVVEGGVIAGVKDVEVEELAEETKTEEEKKTPTPEELATLQAEVTALKTEIAGLKTQLNRKTGTPSPAKTELKTEEKLKGETKLSREAVQKAFKENRNKWR
jgi:hypothetical protein